MDYFYELCIVLFIQNKKIMKSVLDEMIEAKHRFAYLRKEYLEKIKEVKENYKYELSNHSYTAKRDILLGFVFNMGLGWYHFNISHHTNDKIYCFYSEGRFNPAFVFDVKKEKNYIVDLLDKDDWRNAVEKRNTVLGYDEWKIVMKTKPVEESIKILRYRDRCFVGIYSVPELFRGEFLVVAKEDEQRNYGNL